MKHGMTIKYLKYRAVLNFEVDFRVNGAIGRIATKWDHVYVENGLLYLYILSYPINMSLIVQKLRLCKCDVICCNTM